MTSSDPENRRKSPDKRRLESWKEIARYLRRDVRTVQRWEKQEGLPVHRHHHQSRGSVYADPAEIDRWRESRKSTSTRKPEIRWMLAGATSILVIVALVYAIFEVPDGPDTTADAPNPEAFRHYMIGMEYLRSRASPQADHIAAAEAFELAIAVDPSYADAFGALALARATQSTQVMNRGRYEDAIDVANRALSIDPDLAHAHTALGIVYLQQGALDDAQTALDRALSIAPDHTYAGYWRSILLREQARFDESDRQLIDTLNTDPLHPLLNTEYAERLWARGEYERAVAHFEKVLDGPDTPADVLFNLSELHREYGDLERALYWAKETAKVNPRFSGLLAIIRSYATLDMPGRAEFWYRQLEDAEGTGPPRLGIHSQYLYLTGDIEGAYQLKVRYVDDAGISLERLPFAVRETIGGMAILSGRLDEGIAIMEDLFGEEFRIPDHLGGSDFALTFVQFLAYAYQQTGRTRDAERVCAAIDARIREYRSSGDGYSPSFYVVQARNYVLQGRPEQAIAALTRAVELGWRDIVFERQNPVWETIKSDPRFGSLTAEVTADIAAQRSRIEASGLDVADDELVIALLRN